MAKNDHSGTIDVLPSLSVFPMSTTKNCNYAVRAAVEAGDREALEALRGHIDWHTLAGERERLGDFLTSACYSVDNRERLRATALQLLQMAVDDGCTQMFTVWEADEGGTAFVKPVMEFIEGDFPEALVVFMDQGFDPLQVYGMDGLRAVDVAIEQGKDRILMTIRSYLARQRAQIAMVGLDPAAGAPGT